MKRLFGVQNIGRLAAALLASCLISLSSHGEQSSPTVPVHKRHCVLNDPLSCMNTNQLVGSSGFAAAISTFFGTEKGNYLDGAERSLTGQALWGLSGPPERRQPLPGGLFLFAACPSHDCGDQAAALVLTAQGVIEGVGFSGNHCSARTCDSARRYLDFYVRRGPTADAVKSGLASWGQGIHSFKASADDALADRTTLKLLD